MGKEERMRPPVPEIEGLHKGKIEAKRELWASRRRATFADSRADVFVISEESRFYLTLPVLGLPDSTPSTGDFSRHPYWLPRVNKVMGEIYISRWESQENVNSQTQIAFGGKRFVMGMDLTGLPKSWTVARLIPQKFETIESAIEVSEKIVAYEGLGGPAQRRVEELFAALNGISEVFLHESEISPLRLQGLSLQAENLLIEHGFLTARDHVWKKIADFTLRSTSRERRWRINPMVSRILARAAYLKVVHQELRQRAAREKALKLFFYLTDIKIQSRSGIEMAESFLESMGGFAFSKPILALRGEERWISAREALPIEHAIKALIKNNLTLIEVAPYALTARLAEAILVGRIGKSNKQIEELKQSLNDKGRWELTRKSAVEYLLEKDATSARQRMHHAFKVLHEGL